MRKLREIKIGLTVMTAIAAFYLVLVWVNRRAFSASSPRVYELKFAQINGLLEGDPVMVRGFPAGRVADIRIADTVIYVSAELTEDLSIFSDARAEIQPKEIMGGKQVVIEQGHLLPLLPEGSEIPGKSTLDFSSSFSTFSDLLSPQGLEKYQQTFERVDTLTLLLTRIAQAIPPQQLSRSLNHLEESLRQTESLLRQARQGQILVRLDSTLGAGQALFTRIDSTVSHLQPLVNTFDPDALDSLQMSLAQSPALVRELETGLQGINGLLSQLDRPGTVAHQLLTEPEMGAKLDSTLVRLNRVLDQLYRDKVIIGFKKRKR